ncbi:FecR family protein [Plebeiibacterium marinum]|uniref:FecR family protein n=1 Tax=Plebeiibacterium marinum TaxID=2992111 RepID=A0AAE3MGG9_9BACT|nr:FecR family protein [Plebeiobacterium marinum]MCW3807134.1 FecR family protein [Plebeiobacterium marinum]
MERRSINKLIFKFLVGDISRQEKEILDGWINDSGENKKFFEKVCGSKFISESYSNYKQIDYEQAFDGFMRKTGQTHKKIWLNTWVKYAAAVVLLIALATPAYYKWKNSSQEVVPGQPRAILLSADGTEINLEEQSNKDIKFDNTIIATNSGGNISYNVGGDIEPGNSYNTIIIPRGGEYRITLSDGTKVHLNSMSSLKYPIAFNDSVREVQLTGEAYFEIARDKKRPFYVLTDEIKVKQYGTAFNVKNRQKDFVEVVLVHGKVSLIHDNFTKEQVMKPNQLATYSKSSKKVVLADVDIDPYIAWNIGKFIFNDMSLVEIMENLSLWYDVDFQFEDEDLMALRYTGNIPREESLENILNTIQFTTDVKFSVKNKKIVVDN